MHVDEGEDHPALDAAPELLRLTVDIVSAHCTNHRVAAGELPALIRQVYAALVTTGQSEGSEVAERPEPAVPIRKSVFPDYIVCLEDGKKLKMLKRYLRSAYGMTPEAYRKRWDLPSSYPMVAPNYAQRRRTLAKESGLGRTPEREKALVFNGQGDLDS